VLPILRPTANHIHLALTASQADPWAKRVWWDWLGSWVFVGGPFGRWTVGTILGVRILKAKLHNSDQHFPGSIVEQPHLRIIVVAGFGSVLCIFAMVSLSSALLPNLTNADFIYRVSLSWSVGTPCAARHLWTHIGLHGKGQNSTNHTIPWYVYQIKLVSHIVKVDFRPTPLASPTFIMSSRANACTILGGTET
jgi:hypothetical protein